MSNTELSKLIEAAMNAWPHHHDWATAYPSKYAFVSLLEAIHADMANGMDVDKSINRHLQANVDERDAFLNIMKQEHGRMTVREWLETLGYGAVVEFPSSTAIKELLTRNPNAIEMSDIEAWRPGDAVRFKWYRSIIIKFSSYPYPVFKEVNFTDYKALSELVDRCVELSKYDVPHDAAVLQVTTSHVNDITSKQAEGMGFKKSWMTEIPKDKLSEVSRHGMNSKKLTDILGSDHVRRAVSVLYIESVHAKDLKRSPPTQAQKQQLIEWCVQGEYDKVTRGFKNIRKSSSEPESCLKDMKDLVQLIETVEAENGVVLDLTEEKHSRLLDLLKKGDVDTVAIELIKEVDKQVSKEAANRGYCRRYRTQLPAKIIRLLDKAKWSDESIAEHIKPEVIENAKAGLAVENTIDSLTKKNKVNVKFSKEVYIELRDLFKVEGQMELTKAVQASIVDMTDVFSKTSFGDTMGDIFKDFGFDKDTFSKGLSDRLAGNATKKATKSKTVPLTVPAIHKALNAKVIGQTEAKRAIAHSVYILSLLASATRSANTRAVEVPNILLRGPSGCGKTLIASQIAKLLKWKMVKVDCSQITASGYYGGSLSDKLKDISEKVVFLDEIDKLIDTGKDKNSSASTESVQYELLTYLEKQYSNVNCLFVAAGSFANTERELIPELRGRLPVVCNLAKPNADDFINGFKTYHLKKLKAIAQLVSPNKQVKFDADIANVVGHLAYAVAEATPIGYRALDSFTHEISIQLSHDLSEGKDVEVNKDYVAKVFE